MQEATNAMLQCKHYLVERLHLDAFCIEPLLAFISSLREISSIDIGSKKFVLRFMFGILLIERPAALLGAFTHVQT
jgi:hypothetical protein